MQFIDFRDTCVIARDTGQKDKWDEPERETIYDGPCLYEERGTAYARSIITRAPTVFLPEVNGDVQINDHIEITTEYGRTINGNVEIVRDINMPWRSNVQCTRIEIKQAQGS